MENASNALLIAAGVLVAILLVTSIVVSFSGASELAKAYDTKIVKGTLQMFNNNFEKYTLYNVRLQDIITLAHFVIDHNSKNELEETDAAYIHLTCQKEKLDKLKSEKELIEYMLLPGNNFKMTDDGKAEDTTKYQEYTCKEIGYNEYTGLVNEIVFEKAK